jgi:hydroxymethylbilane synthase
VAASIERALGGATEIVPLKTTGDRLKGSLAKVGGKGLFVKEIEEALLDGRADVAVHSAKDLPADEHPELAFVAFPERADPRDALVAEAPGASVAALPRGARVGTGSARRTAQLLRARPDLRVVPIRGNVATRLGKLESGELDAVVLACAGLDRLGYGARIHERIGVELLLPAVGQGALAVQARAGTSLAERLVSLSHPATAARVAAERAFLVEIGGDCSVPMAALADLAGGTITLDGLLIAPDASRVAEARRSGPLADAERIGREVARAVLDDGGREILRALREVDAT